MEIDFEVNKKAINDIKEKLWSGAVLQMLDRSIKKSVVMLNKYAIQETPVDQWRLRSSFSTEFRPLYWRVFNNTQYAIFVHEGTRPHTAPFDKISERAYRHGLNAWSVWLAIKRKWTKANPFMQRAVDLWNDEVDEIFQGEVQRMIDNFIK